MVIDIRRAYFYAPAQRLVYVEIPAEDFEPGDEQRCGRLNGSLYGTRDAASNWDREISQFMDKEGFIKGSASPCIYRHRNMDVAGLVHGDDIVLEGKRSDLEKIRENFKKKYEIRGDMIGLGRGLNRAQSIEAEDLHCEQGLHPSSGRAACKDDDRAT
jgi:hypothetical protein